MNLLRDLSLSLLPPLAVVILQLIRMQLFPAAMELDMFAHALGGASIAWMGTILWTRSQQQKRIPAKIPTWIAAWCIFGLVLFASIAWELFEFAMEHTTGWLFQPSLADTMNDFVMDMLGGITFIGIMYKKLK